MATCKSVRRTYPHLGEQYEEVRHASGLTVLVSPKDFSTYHATLGVAYGSMDRFAGHTVPMGIAHFLEHKMFERIGGSYDDAFSSLGADVNAYTTYDRTSYLFSCTDRFAEALEQLLCMVSELAVTGASVARERAIIAEEIRMNGDDPWEQCYAGMLRALYRHHPVREEICGSETSIRRITPRLLQKTFSAFYRPDRMVLAVSGRVTMAEVLAVVDRVWGGSLSTIPADRLAADAVAAPDWLCLPWPGREPATVAHARVTRRMPTAKPLFCIGVKAPHVPDGARECLGYDMSMALLCEMLFSHSGPFYSDLFERGVISPGMAYSSSVGQGYGYYAISGECDDPEEVYAAFCRYIEHLRDVGLDRNDFSRARRILYADYVTGFDATEDIAASLMGYALDSLRASSSPIGLYDYPAMLEQITFEDVCGLFADTFHEHQYALSTVLPLIEYP